MKIIAKLIITLGRLLGCLVLIVGGIAALELLTSVVGRMWVAIPLFSFALLFFGALAWPYEDKKP
jgi:hypothetical protein